MDGTLRNIAQNEEVTNIYITNAPYNVRGNGWNVTSGNLLAKTHKFVKYTKSWWQTFWTKYQVLKFRHNSRSQIYFEKNLILTCCPKKFAIWMESTLTCGCIQKLNAQLSDFFWTSKKKNLDVEFSNAMSRKGQKGWYWQAPSSL